MHLKHRVPVSASKHPQFVGVHFPSSVDKMRLVELIRGKQTEDETVARAFDYVQALDKVPIGSTTPAVSTPAAPSAPL